MGKIAEKIDETARKAAIKAAVRYSEISTEGTVWNRGVEHWISSKVAEQIHKKHKYPVELELSCKALFEESRLRPNYKKCSVLSEKSRFDVSIFRKREPERHDIPYGVIEVKKRFAQFKWDKDCARILELHKLTKAVGNRGVRFGVLLAVDQIRENQTKDIDLKIEEAQEAISKHIGRKQFEFRIERQIFNRHMGCTNSGVEVTGVAVVSVIIDRR